MLMQFSTKLLGISCKSRWLEWSYQNKTTHLILSDRSETMQLHSTVKGVGCIGINQKERRNNWLIVYLWKRTCMFSVSIEEWTGSCIFKLVKCKIFNCWPPIILSGLEIVKLNFIILFPQNIIWWLPIITSFPRRYFIANNITLFFQIAFAPNNNFLSPK